jgi:hypothetical protein
MDARTATDIGNSSAAALESFRACVRDDPALQQMLQQFADTDAFVDAALEAARRRGIALTNDAVRGAIRERARRTEGSYDGEIVPGRPPPHGWLPIRLLRRDDALYLDWAYFGSRRLRAPFFESDVDECLQLPFNQLFRHVTPIDALTELPQAWPRLPPSGFIFHISRCGSTVMSRMLAAAEANIVVSEASVIDATIQALRRHAVLSEERRARWLAAVVGALGHKRNHGDRHYFVKLDSWHTNALPLFRRAFPDVPWVFLYREPGAVLASHLRMPGTQMLPGVAESLYGLERRYGPGCTEDYFARVLAKIAEPVAAHYRAGGGLLVNYRELPQALFTAVLPHFGVRCSAADRAAMIEAARYDAKSPSLTFVSHHDREREQTNEAARTAAERWLGNLYRSLEALRTADQGSAGDAFTTLAAQSD